MRCSCSPFRLLLIAAPGRSPSSLPPRADRHSARADRPRDRRQARQDGRRLVEGADGPAGRRDRGGRRGPPSRPPPTAPHGARHGRQATPMSSATSSAQAAPTPAPAIAGRACQATGRVLPAIMRALERARATSSSAPPPTCRSRATRKPLIFRVMAGGLGATRAKARRSCGSCFNSRCVPFRARSGWCSARRASRMSWCARIRGSGATSSST